MSFAPKTAIIIGVVHVRKKRTFSIKEKTIYNSLFSAGTQCGMNSKSCYSANSLDRLLIYGGIVLGVIVLLFFILIAYCIRKSIMEERKAKMAKNDCELREIGQRNAPLTSFTNPQLSEFEKGMNVLKNTDELLQRTRQATQAGDQSPA